MSNPRRPVMHIGGRPVFATQDASGRMKVEVDETPMVVWCPRCDTTYVFHATDRLRCRHMRGDHRRPVPCDSRVEPWPEATAVYQLAGNDAVKEMAAERAQFTPRLSGVRSHQIIIDDPDRFAIGMENYFKAWTEKVGK